MSWSSGKDSTLALHEARTAGEIIASGIRAVLTCVDPAQAPRGIAGHWYDEELLRALPEGVDPCGENGEFHTFVTDGPGFAQPLDVTIGETVERDGFVFTDVRPASGLPTCAPDPAG
jgi:diphthamide synthase (EF-2-diphthine--ammonia ligase)